MKLVLHGQELRLATDFFNSFEGVLNDKAIRIVLRPTEDGTVVGKYCDLNNRRVELRGRFHNSEIVLTAVKNDSVQGYFKGIYLAQYSGKDYLGAFYEGTWQNASRTTSSEFKFLSQGYHYGGGFPEKNYPLHYGSDQEIDLFLSHLKKSILNDDADWIANHINYPTRAGIGEGKTIRIDNKKAFLTYYPKIFPEAFKTLIELYFPCLCSSGGNGERARLGRGEIWFENKSGSTEASYDFAIYNIFVH